MSAVKGCQDDQGIGASDLEGEAEGARTLRAGKEKVQGDHINVYKYLMSGSKEYGAKVFSVVPSERTRGSGTR